MGIPLVCALAGALGGTCFRRSADEQKVGPPCLPFLLS